MYGYLIEVETEKAYSLSENLEQGLRYIGKAMQIADEMCEGGSMRLRSNTGAMGYRVHDMGYREDEPPKYDEWGNPIARGEMGMRRMRDSRGRFM